MDIEEISKSIFFSQQVRKINVDVENQIFYRLIAIHCSLEYLNSDWQSRTRKPLPWVQEHNKLAIFCSSFSLRADLVKACQRHMAWQSCFLWLLHTARR